jgi:hypothetical protein
MKKAKIFISLFLASILVLTQAAIVFAARGEEDAGPIAGTIQAVTLATDPNTGVTTVLVKIKGENSGMQSVRISLETAESPSVGLVTLDEDGNPVIVNPLPGTIEIDPTTVIPDEKPHNPVGSTLVLFFADIPDLDYDAVMEAHASGNGFGVIAQALFLTQELGGDATVFQNLLQAKNDNDYSNFPLDDGTIPTSWSQLRKAIAEQKLGTVMSQNNHNGDNDHTNNGNNNPNAGKDKSNHGNSNANGHGNGNGNGSPNKP